MAAVIDVRVSDEDLELGVRLARASYALHLPHRFANEETAAYNYWLGAMGELVTARAYGWPDPAPLRSVDDLGRYDVGRVQVRAGKGERHHLMVAPKDRYHAEDPFVLVVRVTDEHWRVPGWRYGSEVMVDRYWTGAPDHPLHGRVPYECWAVPQPDLRDALSLETAG